MGLHRVILYSLFLQIDKIKLLLFELWSVKCIHLMNIPLRRAKKKYPRVVQWNSSISEQSFLRLCELVTCVAGASTDSKGGSSNMTETGPLYDVLVP